MFRSLGKSKIAFVLAILFAISLFFLKGGSRYSNIFNSDNVVANVSGTPISTSKFNRTMQMNIEKFNQMLGNSLTGDQIRGFQIHSLAISALVNDAIFENEYDKINFKIDEKVIAQKTKERIPQLYNKNNELDKLYLNTFLQQQQLKIEDIVQIINFETRDKYFNDAFFNVNYPKYFKTKINDYKNHKRKIIYLNIKLDDVNLLQNHNKKELQDFYNNNINNYFSNEKRDIEYILINKNNYTNNFIPTNLDIKTYFNNNKDLYFQLEKRSFVQFNFKTIEEAESFKNKTIDFNLSNTLDYANQNNIIYNSFKNLGADEILSQISEPLFKLKLQEKSDIIDSTLAKHIVILESIKSAKQLEFQEVKEEIKKIISKIEVNNFITQLKDEISEEVLSGKSLIDISKIFNLDINNIKNLTRDYNDYDISQKKFISNLIPVSFNANKDFLSDIIDVDDEIFYIFNVKNIETSSPIPFINIEDTVLKDWEKNKKIEKIKIDIKSNLNFINNISKEYNLLLEEVIINDSYNKLPQKFVEDIFKANKNDNIQNLDKDMLYLGKLIDIEIIENSEAKIEINLENDLRAIFSEELIKTKKISTNDNLINGIINQY